ncbi:MAG: c-type cytochrome biogenesis protein CcmI, partial [Rhodobacteraceae bacterium]|nr:c-type cytochrome biogenesis protein CcmI [Paracoccaceae bacterium]
MSFWLVAAGMAGAVFLILALALLRGPAPAGATAAAAADLGVYRDQLAEVGRDLARGTIGPEEAARLRVEVARRLLEADRRGRAEAGAALPGPAAASVAADPGPAGADRAAATPALSAPAAAGARGTVAGLVLILVAAAGSFGLYARIGAPDYPDQPLAGRLAAADRALATRPGQAAAEAALGLRPLANPADPDHAALMARLRAAVAARPDDVEGHRLLAENEAALGNHAAAARAQGRLVALLGDAATAADHVLHADLLIRAANGYVSPEAEAALTEALRRDPANGAARYY